MIEKTFYHEANPLNIYSLDDDEIFIIACTPILEDSRTTKTNIMKLQSFFTYIHPNINPVTITLSQFQLHITAMANTITIT
jgi:hypothetical protein